MPAKKAATKRTASPRGPRVVNFDTERARIVKERKAAKPKQWKAYGKLWDVKQPNVMLAAKVMDAGDDEDSDSTGYFTTYLLAHVVKEQRPDFLKALIGDEDLDIDVLIAMAASLGKVVYGE